VVITEPTREVVVNLAPTAESEKVMIGVGEKKALILKGRDRRPVFSG
jgi:hypothetical protein